MPKRPTENWRNWQRKMNNSNSFLHEPVLVKEVVEALHIKKTGCYIDATLGAAGHAIRVVKAGGKLLGIEADPNMLKIARKNLEETCSGFFFETRLGNFKDIDKIAKESGFTKVNGIFFDLGISRLHYKVWPRGFSFSDKTADLDMRLDAKSQNTTAADLLKVLRKDQLTALFAPITGKGKAQKLAQKIILVRQEKEIKKVADLLEIVGQQKRGRTHPATEIFLSLRIAVNSELENLKEALPKAFSLLEKEGKLLVISFHSLEDALVKSFFREMADQKKAKIVNKKPIIPSAGEVGLNPSARSAKLRVLEKI